MKNTTFLKVLLAVSLGFNIFFGIGFMASKSVLNNLKSPEGRADLLTRRLSLEGSQAQAFKELLREYNREKEQLIADYSKELDVYWSELLKSEPDTQKTEAAIARTSELTVARKRLFTKYFTRTNTILDPKQREQLIGMVRQWQL